MVVTFLIRQVMVDASGIMLARPDNYLPPVDIIKDADEKYTIYLDVPGMTRENIRLSRQVGALAPALHGRRLLHMATTFPIRQNVVTIVKGVREPEFTERELATTVARQARAFAVSKGVVSM